MLGCSYGTVFKTTVAGGSYQNGLTVHMQGVPPGMDLTEEEIYRELLLRKPGQGELTSPRREPDVPIIYSGINAADTMPGFENAEKTNGTPLVLLIPNLDRHFEHIDQYQRTNRTPRPGHASYATYQKYGEWDDAIGAGIFSGRYTSTIVAAGAVAKKVLERHGIRIVGYVREAAGIRLTKKVSLDSIWEQSRKYREIRRTHDPIYREIFGTGKFKKGMRFIDKVAVLAELEKKVPEITHVDMDEDEVRAKYGVNPKLFCPDLETADAMVDRIIEITEAGDSSGGVVEVVADGIPAGLGEPIFRKLDGEIGKMLSIGAVKGVSVGCGFDCKDMTGATCNDQMGVEDGKVVFESNNNGGVTGGVTTGQPIVVNLAVKPTPTIGIAQHTIDKVSLENATLDAVTRRDPTIVPRVWPVAEGFLALIIADALMQHYGYRGLWNAG